MSRRAEARDETRRRIVEATVRLHGRHGILGTSWREIAREADVSAATVYAHFPSLAELLPACGAHVMDLVRPPRGEQAAALVEGCRSLRERLDRIAGELFSYYERGGPLLEVDVRERELPGMREWEESERGTVTAFVRAALAGERADAGVIEVAGALLDPPVYRAMRARGMAPRTAARTSARLIECLVTSGRRPDERQEDP